MDGIISLREVVFSNKNSFLILVLKLNIYYTSKVFNFFREIVPQFDEFVYKTIFIFNFLG